MKEFIEKMEEEEKEIKREIEKGSEEVRIMKMNEEKGMEGEVVLIVEKGREVWKGRSEKKIINYDFKGDGKKVKGFLWKKKS